MSIERNIINNQGQIVGVLTFPDGTSEETIASKLEVYTKAPPISDVTPRQIRQALILQGITMAQIDTALGTLPEPMKSLAIVEWEYSIAFKRNNPLVESVGQMLGWNSQMIDDLWRFAATL